VSISSEAIRKAVGHARTGGSEQVIGFLIGRMQDQVLIIEDAVSGRIEAEEGRVVVPAVTIAKIADGILTRRIKGNIVGWYHSHPGYGVFMSDRDVATQKSLHQFSPYVVAMVIDSLTEEYSFFSMNCSSMTVAAFNENDLYVHDSGEDPIPSSFKKRS